MCLWCCGASEEDRIRGEIMKKYQEAKKDPWGHFNANHCIIIGAGETGKSTFVKNLQIIYEDGHKDPKERRKIFKEAILTCIMTNLIKLINVIREYRSSSNCIY